MADYRGYGDGAPVRYQLNAGRLWASGVATAVVAALVAVAGLLIARGLFKVAVLAPKNHDVWGDARTVTYALVSACAAMLATGLMHLLCVAVAQPRTFFRWIMALVTLIAVILPLTLTEAWSAKVATALINLAIGVAVTIIIDNVAALTRRPAAGAGGGWTGSYPPTSMHYR